MLVRWAACGLIALLTACEMPPPPPPSSDAPPPAPPSDAPPPAGDELPGLTAADVSAGEADGVVRFNVTRSAANTATTISYATEDGSATAGADYQRSRGTVRFAAGSTETQPIEVTIIADRIAEDDETFTLHLSDRHGSRLAVVTATIVDDDTRGLIVEPAALNVSEGGSASYTVRLRAQPTGRVRVSPRPDSARLSVAPDELSFTAADWELPQAVTVTAAEDEGAVRVAHVVSGDGYGGTGEALPVTIVDDDVSTLALASARAVEDEAVLRFEVTLSLAGDHPVTVDYATTDDGATAGQDYERATGELRFPAGSTAAQTIEVALFDDVVDEPDERLTVTLSNATVALALGEDTLTASGTIEDDDPLPVLSIEHGSLTEGEGDGLMRFAVRLDTASGRAVTVRYATADGTATAGEGDYTAARGTLRFPAGSTARMVTVEIADDTLDEEEREAFTVSLSNAVHATLVPSTSTATGTIEDDDPLPVLSIEHGSLTEGEGDGLMRFAVRLDTASGRAVTVRYATADGTATAGEGDYTAARGTLRFPAGSTARMVTVEIADDTLDEEEREAFTVSLSNAVHATLVPSASTATGTIEDDDEMPDNEVPSTDRPSALELASLQVAGGGTMFPEFASDIFHYALTCADSPTLQVTATAARSGASLTLLRADQKNNVVSTGALNAELTVNENHDVVVELTDTDGTVRYIVHCLPGDFYTFRVLAKTADATGGLLFVTLPFHYAVVDYNGVTRYQYPLGGRVFRPHSNGPQIDGKRVRYSVLSWRSAILLDSAFQRIRAVAPLGSLLMDNHDFVLGTDSYLFISYVPATRDYTIWGDDLEPAQAEDSVISEVAFAGTDAGTERHQWNSWDHLKIVPDCEVLRLTGQYAHLNSLQLVDGDIIASFLGCAQVVRIDRSSGTWAVEWKLGGSDTPRSSDTEYLDIVGDPLGEFCGQHHATLTDDEHVLLFDNGVHCLGERKAKSVVSRVVEYDISSGTRATFVREYRRPAGHGYSHALGGVTLLDNGNWLIAWGGSAGRQVSDAEVATVTEVATDGTAVFHLNATRQGSMARTYRAYHDDESDVSVPLNLP
ncbi:MAG: hypothetical protein OXQ31_11480 [Spirochaetaceae bacterium]|nr:hypothetical protein [Spirochaetaceae bacterium]